MLLIAFAWPIIGIVIAVCVKSRLKYCFFDAVDTIHQVLSDIIAPEPQDTPATVLQLPVNLIITLYITLNLRYPILAIILKPGYFFCPVLPVPEFSITKDGYPVFGYCYIWAPG